MDGDKGWLFPPERLLDGTPKEWTDYIGRLAMKAVIEVHLKDLLRMTDDDEMIELLLRSLLSLNTYYEVNERVIRRHEGKGIWDRFRLLHRLLTGAASEFSALAAGKPEMTCSAFKARQVNRILTPLKELVGDGPGMISEDEDLSCSDVSLLLRSWLDLCAEYARRHYDGNPPDIPYDSNDYRHRLVQERILAFCQDEPKSILEIGEMLCYRDRKTVHKYMDPLLSEGLLARTVPDRPNSRNQKYITARMI